MPNKQQIQNMLSAMNVRELRKVSKYFGVPLTNQSGGYRNKNSLVDGLVGGARPEHESPSTHPGYGKLTNAAIKDDLGRLKNVNKEDIAARRETLAHQEVDRLNKLLTYKSNADVENSKIESLEIAAHHLKEAGRLFKTKKAKDEHLKTANTLMGSMGIQFNSTATLKDQSADVYQHLNNAHTQINKYYVYLDHTKKRYLSEGHLEDAVNHHINHHINHVNIKFE